MKNNFMDTHPVTALVRSAPLGYNMRTMWQGLREDTFPVIKEAHPENPVSFPDFVHVIDVWDKSFVQTMPITAIQEIYADYLLWRSGDKQYDIHPNLVRRLMDSNIKSVPTEFLRLPFNAIRINIEKEHLFFFTSTGDQQSVHHFIVAHTPDENGDPCIRVLMRSADINSPNGDISFFRIILNHPNVDECVKASISAMDVTMRENFGKVTAVELQQDERDSLVATFTFVTKAVLYINGANADVYWNQEANHDQIRSQLLRVQDAGKRRKLAQQLSKRKGSYLVGHKIIISREEHEYHENVKKGLWKVGYRFVVQGHFRNQPCGTGNLERKIIFINPFYKGPEYAETINSQHSVK